MTTFDAVDDFLMAHFAMRLEDVLCDGCFVGRLGSRLADNVKLLPRLIRSAAEEDGGVCNAYRGVLILDGVWYRFACQIFVDGGGQRFLSDVTEFAAVEWQARVALSA
jgi:hypothetical protein